MSARAITGEDLEAAKSLTQAPSVSVAARRVLLRVEGLDKHFGGLRAVDDASFEIEEGVIAGMIGPNGAGKTTAFNCVAGFLKPDGGKVFFGDREITGWPTHRIFGEGLVRTFQIPQELESMTVLENVMLAGEEQLGEAVWRNWFAPWERPPARSRTGGSRPRGAGANPTRASGLRLCRHTLTAASASCSNWPAR